MSDTPKGRVAKVVNAKKARSAANVLPPPTVPMAVARRFASKHCTRNGVLTVRHWRGGWWSWKTSHWYEIEERTVRSVLYAFTESACYRSGKGLAPWAPTRRKIGDLADALAAVCHLQNNIDQPSWLDGRATGIIVAVANGLLDVNRRLLIPHTPQFFNQTSVPFGYNPNAAEPECWREFLTALWRQEPEAINALGEWFGYVISGRLDLHKILLMVGPTRGGKGVIARILTALVGRANVAGPTLSSFAGDFGLAPLIGKPLAIISDARFVGKNSGIVVERLLSISGEDTLTVNRKYRDQWTGKLPSRLHVISNELPRLGDASQAIVGRIVLLPLSRSWLGKEDHDLETKLSPELPGILNWALDGLQRLAKNEGRFTRVPAADDAVTLMRDLASPVAAFVRQRCEVGGNKRVAIDTLYGSFKTWCEDNGHSKITKQTFGRDLRAAVPSIDVEQPRTEGGKRTREYVGIELRPHGENKEAA
jgi:putative DNA primase/helicase